MGFGDAAVVVEAVPERLDLKRAVFAELDKLVPPGVPVATNASGFRITDISEGCETRGRMANLHFFLPAHLVPGVEVVQGEHTDPAACDRLAEIMSGLGRQVVRVARDVPGFLANRIQHALMREAFHVIDSGLASAEDVDRAVRFCFGFRYLAAGPIMQKELAGLETQLAAAATIYPSLHNGTEPSPTFSAPGGGRAARAEDRARLLGVDGGERGAGAGALRAGAAGGGEGASGRRIGPACGSRPSHPRSSRGHAPKRDAASCQAGWRGGIRPNADARLAWAGL